MHIRQVWIVERHIRQPNGERIIIHFQ